MVLKIAGCYAAQKLEFQISNVTGDVINYYYHLQWHTIPVLTLSDTILSHPPCCASIQPMSPEIADAAGTDAVLFGCNWWIYQI